jgi:hypothetical protein
MTINISKKQLNIILDSINMDQISNVKKFILFIGHAHSGHSIVGSILDAHESTSIANEINIPKLILDHKLNKNEILKICLYFSLNNKSIHAWENTEYKYAIKNSFQGLTTNPVILGDKKAGGSTRVMLNHPWILNYLIEIFGSQLYFVFVDRNPLEIISAYSHYWKDELNEKHIDRYFENLGMVRKIQNLHKVIYMSQLMFKDNPAIEIKNLCNSLDLGYSESFIKSVSNIVRSDIKPKSENIVWTDSLTNYYNKMALELS